MPFLEGNGRLGALRVQAEISQSQLATALGVTVITVSRWERGQHRPNPAQIRAIAKAIGEPVDKVEAACKAVWRRAKRNRLTIAAA